MKIDTVCPHCGAVTPAVLAKISYCVTCQKPLVCIKPYCASRTRSECRCYEFLGQHYCLVDEKPLSPLKPLPTHLNASKPLRCSACDYGWGLQNIVIEQKGVDIPRPFSGHFIVPLEHHLSLTLYHGTRISRLESIQKKGLQPPRSQKDKSHGFPTEERLRYTGRDLEAAQSHAIDDCILDLSYSGFIAITAFTARGASLNQMIDHLPHEVGGIQYHESGKSIAFRPEAELTITRMPAIPKLPDVWFIKLCKKIFKAL